MIDTSLIDTASTDILIDWYHDLMDLGPKADSTLADITDELDRRGVDRNLI